MLFLLHTKSVCNMVFAMLTNDQCGFREHVFLSVISSIKYCGIVFPEMLYNFHSEYY